MELPAVEEFKRIKAPIGIDSYHVYKTPSAREHLYPCSAFPLSFPFVGFFLLLFILCMP